MIGLVEMDLGRPCGAGSVDGGRRARTVVGILSGRKMRHGGAPRDGGGHGSMDEPCA